MSSCPSPFGENDVDGDPPSCRVRVESVTGTPVGEVQKWELPYPSVHETCECRSTAPDAQLPVSPVPMKVPSGSGVKLVALMQSTYTELDAGEAGGRREDEARGLAEGRAGRGRGERAGHPVVDRGRDAEVVLLGARDRVDVDRVGTVRDDGAAGVLPVPLDGVVGDPGTGSRCSSSAVCGSFVASVRTSVWAALCTVIVTEASSVRQ